MRWIAALTVAAGAYAAAALAAGLAIHIEHRPERSSLLTDGLRGVGFVIALAGLVLGTVVLGHAVAGFAW